MKRVDISGFDGPYENACQTMLQRWIEATKDKTFDEVFPEGKLDVIIEARFHELIDDLAPSGAMWGATMSHFGYIKKNGYEAWLKFGEKRDRIIEWKAKDAIHFESPEAAFEAGKKIGESAHAKAE